MVVNCRTLPAGWKQDKQHVYIGRPGKYGNPVVIGQKCPICGDIHRDGGDTLPCYKRYLWNWILTGGFAQADVDHLTGKTLVCWCKPAPCHGDILESCIANWDKVLAQLVKQ